VKINYYVDDDDRYLFGLLVKPFKEGVVIDLEGYRRCRKLFFSNNMQVVVQRVKDSGYMMSVVRNDGGKFECLDYLPDLRSQLFPYNYRIEGGARRYEESFEPLYPVCVIFDRVFRQSRLNYDESSITRCIIKRVGL